MLQKVYHIGEYDSRQNVGVVTSANTLIKYLRKLGIDIEYITYDNMPKKKVFMLYRLLSALNFPRMRMTRNLNNLWAIRAIQEVDEGAILHLHSFTLLPHLLQSLNNPKGVILSYYGTHSGIIEVGGYTNPYYLRAILSIPDAVIVDEIDRNRLLERTRRYFPGNETLLEKRMAVFPFIGIDDEVFDPKKVKTHPWYKQNLHTDGLIVFKGGAIEKWKGDLVLVKIANEVLSKRKDIYFIWAGYFRTYPSKDQAILKKALMRLCERYPKNVFYIGKYLYTDLPSFLKGADVVPHFHKKEMNLLSTFGREATMMGRYMLASNIGWYRDLMDKSNGLSVFDWEDDNKLIQEAADELTYLADNLDEARNKGLENRMYASKYCSAKVSAQQHKIIYESLANNEAVPTTEELLSVARRAEN